ncbi:MAG TPA: hypothetical protein DCG19_10915, partial [Cryomorphaceae bacterium]|nr:hypothetical protein [Cryomorphaceae bacterium]
MKTCRLLLIFTVCLFSGPVFPQLAFKDALTLRTLDHRLSEGQVQFLQQDSATLMDILKNHSVYSTYQGIAKDFENNPFIALSHSASQSIAPSDQPNVPSDFSLGGLSGFNVTHIADGLARFLVERTKQELSVAFFEKFKEQLEAQRQLQILFPSTFQRLEAIGDDIYRFSAYLESLRTAFQQDLTSLLPHLRQLIQDPSMDQVFAQNPVLRIILSDGLYLVMQLNDDKHIGDALNSYISYEASPAHLDSINSNIYPSLALLNTISQSLRNDTPANGSYWVRSQDFAELKDEVTLKLYLGLLYQQLELFEIEHNQQLRIGNRPVLDFLEKGNQDFSKFRDTAIALISPVVQEGKEIDVKLSYILNLQQQGQKANYTDFYELMQASLNFLETVKKTYQLVSGEKVPLGFDRFLKLTHSLGDMYVDINEKRYASAVSELVSLYQE